MTLASKLLEGYNGYSSYETSINDPVGYVNEVAIECMTALTEASQQYYLGDIVGSAQVLTEGVDIKSKLKELWEKFKKKVIEILNTIIAKLKKIPQFFKNLFKKRKDDTEKVVKEIETVEKKIAKGEPIKPTASAGASSTALATTRSSALTVTGAETYKPASAKSEPLALPDPEMEPATYRKVNTNRNYNDVYLADVGDIVYQIDNVFQKCNPTDNQEFLNDIGNTVQMDAYLSRIVSGEATQDDYNMINSAMNVGAGIGVKEWEEAFWDHFGISSTGAVDEVDRLLNEAQTRPYNQPVKLADLKECLMVCTQQIKKLNVKLEEFEDLLAEVTKLRDMLKNSKGDTVAAQIAAHSIEGDVTAEAPASVVMQLINRIVNNNVQYATFEVNMTSKYVAWVEFLIIMCKTAWRNLYK